MSNSRSRPASTSSSLLQDVPGAYPADNKSLNDLPEYKSLSQAVHARRAEYMRSTKIKIKVGTWNSAGYKGKDTEQDVGKWFVDGKGVAEALSGLDISSPAEPGGSTDDRETVESQEARFGPKQSTLPKGDPGFLPGGEEIGLYLLGLQEVVNISSATEALRPYSDPEVALKFKRNIEAALPIGYRLIAEQQLIGLLLLAYAAPNVATDIKSVSTTSVGTGLMGYMGNKGAVTARFVIGETTRLVFINAHLAAGADKAALERRNWDYSQIMSRTRFDPIRDSMDLNQTSGEVIGDEDVAFFVGDLNYRLKGVPGEDVRRLLMLHTRNEYDLSEAPGHKIDGEISKDALRAARRRSSSAVSSESHDTSEGESDEEASIDLGSEPLDPSSDPTSLQTTLASLLPHDELQQQIKQGKAFQDWREGPITFLPTYKYDAGSVGVFDTSEKRRAPSWCDRIMYRTRRDMLAYQSRIAEAEAAKKRDEEMKNSGVEEAAKDEELLYDYDPDEDAAENAGEYDDHDDADSTVIVTKEGFEDELVLEHYTSHQRVLSSDHKPLTAVYSLKYDYVVPELKAKVHQEVARELDRAENEERPSITVVVDRHHSELEISDEDPARFEGVSFGAVRYGMHKHRNLTIANTGRVPATVSFIDRPVVAGESPSVAPVWLSLKFDDGSKVTADNSKRFLEPGETFTVELELRILSVSLARDFNEGIRALDDILVIRVESGRDHFVPLRGSWLDSSLGHSIDKLVRIPEGGIRKLQRQRPSSDNSGSRRSSVSSHPVKWSAPRELFRLTETVEDLTVRAVAEWGMVSGDNGQAPWDKVAAWPFAEESWIATSMLERHDRMAALADVLDSDSALENALPPTIPLLERLECLANFLLLFLEGLSDGIITEKLWSQVEEGMLKAERERKQTSEEEQRTWIQEVLSQSSAHSISFILLCAMMDRIINEVASAHAASLQASSEQPKRDVASYMLPGALIRRKTMTMDPAAAYRQELVKAMTAIFAPIVVRSTMPTKEREKIALLERKMKMLELFLSKE